MSAVIAIRRGAVYLSVDVYETYFSGLASVVFRLHAGALHILPVQALAAGGCLLKIRNAQGDRVASAPDFFADKGLLDWTADALAARWSTADGALLVDVPDTAYSSPPAG